jgi:prepilin-type N-terminal cleavage/methylation domain-containing protein
MKKHIDTQHHKRGYTLFELMVAIAIIALLIAVAATAYSTLQKKARDAKRTSDLKAFQQAEEQYYAEHGEYSDLVGSGTACADSIGTQMPTTPIDPKEDGTYTYKCFVNTTTAYCVSAKLESGTGNCNTCDCSVGDTCTLDTSATTSYCVSSLQ